MREVIPVKCSIVRGGTSKGIFIMENELPVIPNCATSIFLRYSAAPMSVR